MMAFSIGHSFIDQCYSLLSNCFVAFVGYMYIMYLQDCHTKDRLFTDNMYQKLNRLFSVSSFKNSTVTKYLLISSQLEYLSLYDHLLVYYPVRRTYVCPKFYIKDSTCVLLDTEFMTLHTGCHRISTDQYTYKVTK